MSTNAGTIEVPSRPAGFVVWAGIVSVLAVAALIMSAMALTQAERTSSGQVASVSSSTLWDAGELEAMQGRVLAETKAVEGAPLWDAGELEAMQGRVLAETVAVEGTTLWDVAKLEAMQGRTTAG
jgi:hypothetical protein